MEEFRIGSDPRSFRRLPGQKDGAEDGRDGGWKRLMDGGVQDCVGTADRAIATFLPPIATPDR